MPVCYFGILSKYCAWLRNPASPWMVETQTNNGMFTSYQLVQDFAGPSTVGSNGI